MTASRRRLLTGPLLGKCHGRTISEPGVPSLSVIELSMYSEISRRAYSRVS